MNLTVETSAFVQLNSAAAYLALYVAGGLQLEATFRNDIAVDAAADHSVLRHDVAGHFSSAPDNDGLAGPQRSFHAALDPDRTVRLAVANDLHTLRDQRDRGIVAGLIWFCHGCPFILIGFLLFS